MDYLGSTVNWIVGLFKNRGMPSALLEEYLQGYREALRAELDDRGQMILGWFGRFLDGASGKERV